MKLNLVERNSWRSPAQLEFATHRTDKPSVWQSVRYNLPPTPPADDFEECVFEAKDQPLKAVTTSEEPLVAVIGVGYVGLHLVTAFAPVYKVIAFDISKDRVNSIAVQLDQSPSITLTSNRKQLANATHFLIAVPTSLLANKRINTSYLEDAIDTVASYARPGATVVIESSVSVGMTRQLLEPLMRSRGLRAGMSPEVCSWPTSSCRAAIETLLTLVLIASRSGQNRASHGVDTEDYLRTGRYYPRLVGQHKFPILQSLPDSRHCLEAGSRRNDETL